MVGLSHNQDIFMGDVSYALSKFVAYFEQFELLKLMVSVNDPTSSIRAISHRFNSRMLKHCTVTGGQVGHSHVRNGVYS